MKFNSLFVALLALLTVSIGNLTFADVSAKNTKAIIVLLSQTIPAKNDKIIIERMNVLAPQVKKAEFPANDASLVDLSRYTSDAIKNADFKTAYQKLISELPKDVHNSNHWLDKLENATTTPTEYFYTSEGNFVSMSACKPHDCPTNIKLIYNPKTKALWGLMHIDQKKSYLLGHPSDDQVALLLIAIGDEINLY